MLFSYSRVVEYRSHCVLVRRIYEKQCIGSEGAAYIQNSLQNRTSRCCPQSENNNCYEVSHCYSNNEKNYKNKTTWPRTYYNSRKYGKGKCSCSPKSTTIDTQRFSIFSNLLFYRLTYH